MSKQEPKRTRTPKDQIQSVNLALDENTRAMLLDLNELQLKSNPGVLNIPMSATARYAIHIAHKAIFDGRPPRREAEASRPQATPTKAPEEAPQPSKAPEPSGSKFSAHDYKGEPHAGQK